MTKKTIILAENNFSAQRSLQSGSKFLSAEPLWKRVPTRDAKGKPYTDFMMLIPGLKEADSAYLSVTINKLDNILKSYEKDIVLVDLNLKINILWITLQPHFGLTSEIAALIHHVVPQAKLISQHAV